MTSNMENFNFTTLQNLNFNQQKEYITKYFVPLTNGLHCFYKDNAYETMSKETLKDVYFNRFDEKLYKYYFKEYSGLKNLVYEINKPPFYDNNINLCPSLPTYKPFKDFDESIQTKAKIFLDYMFEILCNKDKVMQKYLNQWIGNLCRGNKNDSAIVLKTLTQGVGKSTLPIMLSKHILGNKLSLESTAEPLRNKFNSILGGKLFVYFEELETFSKSDWMAVECILKRQITSDQITLQKKNQDSYEAKNINNYMLLSNHEVQAAGRRFCPLDVQTHRKGDTKYWSNLYNNCFNNEVGGALYSYFMEVDITDFNPQEIPITTNKLNSISKSLDSAYLFLKENYILQNKDLKQTLNELYDEYQNFCITKGVNRKSNKNDFVAKLSEIQITHYKTKGYNSYKISLDTLNKIAEKNHWINELDEYENHNNENIIIDDEKEELKKENEELKLKIQELENKLKLLEEVDTEVRNETIKKLQKEINLLGCDNTKLLLQDYIEQLHDIHGKINFQNAVSHIETDIDEFKFFEEEELKKHTKEETIIEEPIIEETIIEKPKLVKKKKSMKKPKQVQENISIEITKQGKDEEIIIKEEDDDSKYNVYSLEDIDDLEL